MTGPFDSILVGLGATGSAACHALVRRGHRVLGISGHGFKFASVIGEIVVDLIVEGRCGFDLTPFRLGRMIPDPADG